MLGVIILSGRMSATSATETSGQTEAFMLLRRRPTM